MDRGYTPLPYVFDLLYDVKTVEELHAHLTGARRTATSATDQELVLLAREHSVPLPEGLAGGLRAVSSLAEQHAELLALVTTIFDYVTASSGKAELDAQYLARITGEALRKHASATR